MTDREAFKAWLMRPEDNGSGVSNADYLRLHQIDASAVEHGWQAALASERAKQSATTNVGIDWANPATLNGSAPPAVQAEPVALHIDPITPDDRKRYYDFEKYADHLPTCKQPRGDQSCECGYSAVRINLSDLLDELSAPAQQEPKYVLASERAKPTIKTQLQQAQESYERQAEPVAWMVGNDPMTAATYNAGDKEKAFDAAKRWNWPITGLSVIAGAPDFDINYQQTKPVGEWRMKNGEPIIGWFLMIGNIVSGILNMWVAFNGFPPNFVVGVLNFIVGGWILKLLLED